MPEKGKKHTGLSRRKMITAMGMLPMVPGLLSNADMGTTSKLLVNPGPLPHKDMFSIKGTYINAAYTHPMSKGSAEAMRKYLDFRQINGREADTIGADRDEARTLFARLINADADEISWIPSTMVGENLIVSGLGISGTKARVVTDAYHFDGSLYLYNQLAKQGLDLQIILPKNNAIELNEMEAAIKPGTKLVAVSLVSMINGFQHDLKKLCDIAHSRGALVFADIIQGAGSVPIDVHDSGIDFCACSTYKWLMGDFGVGFLYVRKDRLPLLKRSQYGYRQVARDATHVFPFDPPGNTPFEFTPGTTTRAHFEVGTLGNAAVPALKFSLNYLLNTGVKSIQQYRQPLIDRLQKQLTGRGYLPMTPQGSSSPIVSFAMENAGKKLKGKLDAAGINIQLYQNRFRISPSVYNTMDDIDYLIATLS